MTIETIAACASETGATGINGLNSAQIGNATLHLGDCLDVMRSFADNSVDSIVTDPPYGLSFMGKKWDYDVPSEAIWLECLRVLKPGGHLLAFAGTRTQHRMACRIEDAGFEIRDMIAWVYGSGFPKSLDVSQAIDRASGHKRERVTHPRGKGFGDGVADTYAHDKWTTENAGTRSDKTPATEAARQWQGWGTALKPALEPITLARKPLIGTVAANVLQHGTGALNIDGCRVSGEPVPVFDTVGGRKFEQTHTQPERRTQQVGTSAIGRWPANLIHDGSDEVLAGFPVTSSGLMTGGTVRSAQDEPGSVCYGTYGGNATSINTPGDTGSAARFFYCAKASAEDRNEGMHSFAKIKAGVGDERPSGSMNECMGKGAVLSANHHPTVKPTDLMRYLLRLVTPAHGVALDPFLGSGSTGKAAMLEDFKFIGIERDPAYFAIACARLEYSIAQGSLFAA